MPPKRWICSAIASIANWARWRRPWGGLDALIFTAGIGEHSSPVREKVCALAGWMGIALDGAANTAHAEKISTVDSRVPVFVLPTNEEMMIAKHTRAVVRGLAQAAQ